MKRTMAVSLVACLAGLYGCGAQEALLGTEGSHLLTAMDALTTPGEEVDLTAQVRAGDFLRGRAGYAVRFYRGGKLYKVAETGSDGIARASFVPAAVGDHEFLAELAPLGMAGEPPAAQRLVLACRKPDTPIVVVDLDRTVVATGFHTVLVGTPEPMARSQQVLARLAGTHTLVYLTHRPDYFSAKSKAWLAEHGYPPGVLLLSTLGGFFKGSGAFKTDALAQLGKRFTKIEIGIGDKVSDAQAYHDHGLRAFLVIQLPDRAAPEVYERLAEELGTLDEKVQVVTDWRQIEEALFAAGSFGRAAMQQRLKQLAEQAKARPKPAARP